jgi:ankyrin repeat protein
MNELKNQVFLTAVKYFIENGVNLNGSTKLHSHPLVCAIRYRQLDIIKYLISQDNIIIPGDILEVALKYCDIDIIKSFSGNFIDFVKLLL